MATLVVEGTHGNAVRVSPPPGVITAWQIYTRDAPGGRPAHIQVHGTEGKRRLMVLRSGESAGMVFELGALSQAHCWDLARHLARNVVTGTLGLEPESAVVQQWVGAVKAVCALLERFPALSDIWHESSDADGGRERIV